MTTPLSLNESYIAITANGFVDGACFTESEDTKQWVAEMQSSGMRVARVGRAEAKRLLYTHLDAREMGIVGM